MFMTWCHLVIGSVFLMLRGMSIEHIVLQEEDDVEDYCYVAQPKLYRVARYAGPIVLQRGIDNKLRQR